MNTRKLLEQDYEYGELTRKIEHGIRSHLRNIPYELLDDLTQTAWLHLLEQPEEKRDERLAFLYGKKAAERHWKKQKTNKEGSNLQTDKEGNVVDKFQQTPDKRCEVLGGTRSEDLIAQALKVMSKEELAWLLTFVSAPGFKCAADNDKAQVLLTRLEVHLV